MAMEKFFNIKCRYRSGPNCVVLVATIRALKWHAASEGGGGAAFAEYMNENLLRWRRAAAIWKHIAMRGRFACRGFAVNKSSDRSGRSIWCGRGQRGGARTRTGKPLGEGGAGAANLASVIGL